MMMIDATEIIASQLRIPKAHVKNYKSKKNLAFILAHSDWVSSLLSSNEIPEFILNDVLTGDEIHSLFFDKEKPRDWCKLLVNVVSKPKDDEFVIPLPRARAVHSNNESDLSFAQLLHYISETNFKNMWKHFYKKYLGDNIQNKNRDYLKGNSSRKNNDILIDLIRRCYGCRIISESNVSHEYFSPYNVQCELGPHPNILPALCAIETKNYFLIFHYVEHIVTLKDCLTFSPTIINSSYTKPLFLIYQLLQVMKNSHDKGLILGNLHLDDVFVSDSLFIQVIPNLEENICKLPSLDCEHSGNIPEEHSDSATQLFPKFIMSKLSLREAPSFPRDLNLKIICSKWINKQISNFDYLMYLNHFAGRRFGDPSCHFIMPWVSDFTTRSNGAWRDLSKSKFRLNKGDRQLDLTYENALNSSQIPHHVSDVLSEITYYVYLSRRTPRSILCRHVRSVWVPAEYPSSVQRLQEWTPDECIPEFFYDPIIFKSIHEDLPDLELPHWALTPEEFIEAHRECLESKFVSERLHHWIDLTFGYKLSGSAAVKSKNVCLHLVESHRKLKTSGVVQLFQHPHPPRQTQMQYYEKVPPKILLSSSVRQPKVSATQSDKGAAGSEDEGQSSGNGEDDSFGTKSSPLIFSKLLSRSKGSLLAPFQSSSNEDGSRSESQKNLIGNQVSNLSAAAASTATTTIINVPKEFNPSALLNLIETNQNFFRKTFLTDSNVGSLAADEKSKFNPKQMMANKRIQEMQVLGCLIVELFLHAKIRVLNFTDLDRRLKACLNFSNVLPSCLRPAVRLLLQPSRDLHHYPHVTSSGLPPPSAHQLLQPLLSSFVLPFPKLFPVVYSSVSTLILSSRASTCQKLWNPRGNGIRNDLSALKVKKFRIDLDKFWDESLSSRNDQIVELIFPFVKELFDDPETSRLSVILFLDKICRSLGPKKTNDLLLETLANLYSNSNPSEKTENLHLYHRKFLLILIVRCGLKSFLENFVGPLMEVVGGYKDSADEKWNSKLYSDEHQQEGEEEEEAEDGNLDPEVDSSPESDEEKEMESKENSEVEVFSFDQDEGQLISAGEEMVRKAVEHLHDLNLSSNVDQQGSEEVPLTPNSSHVQSPEIAIPVAGVQNRRKNISHEEEGDDDNKSPRKSFADGFSSEWDSIDLSQIKASDVAGDSIVWLAHRLGPVLTSRHLLRNLLRVLSLCFTGKDNLEPCKFKSESEESKLWKISVLKWKVAGDENAETVLRVLGEITELYGEQIILLQYLPFMSELINLNKKKFTLALEGGVIGCLTLLKYIVPFMNDATLMNELQDVVLKGIIHPVIRLVSSRFEFPSGQRGRYTLVSKLVDCLYLISLRIGAEMTKVHIAVPALQRFFLAFDKANGIRINHESDLIDQSETRAPTSPKGSGIEDRYLEIQRDGTTTEWSVRDVPGEPISFSHVRSTGDSSDSSPCESSGREKQEENSVRGKAADELRSVFDSHLAHQCYTTFLRFLGDSAMENCLKNQDSIRDLIRQHEGEPSQGGGVNQSPELSKGEQGSERECVGGQDPSGEREAVGSFGSNVAVIGNKIELQAGSEDSLGGINRGLPTSDLTSLICREKKDSARHLRGNWLAYWEHEIGRSEKDNKFNFKQIKLQSFVGHGNSVRMIHCLENENSFISGSKDKTVKLWSLRSQGDGNYTNGCQFTYSQHRKSLLSISFIPTIRLVASCDSIIHFWDPFEGKTISIMDNSKVAPVNVLKSLNPPSCNIVAATTDATLKIVDARICSFVSEYKISLNSVGLIRSICVSPSGNWIAVGQASGLLTVLDVRTGMVLSSWKGHEAEVLQLAAASDGVLMSSSLDQTVSAWNSSDGKFKFYMKGPAEPVHCLAVYNGELITGTTANRIGVHTSIDGQASFSSTKLRSDAFKGILTSMTVLPLNKLLLLGADNGNVTLLC